MGRLLLKGSVVHSAGAWGALVPAADATVEIIQHHFLSTDTTVIWTGQTDASGLFQGQSSEWRRTRTVGIGALKATELDPTDVLALTARVTHGTGSARRQATWVYVWLGDNVPTPPLIVSWEPPTARKGAINGITCYSYIDILRRACDAVRNGQSITVDLRTFGPGTHGDLVRLKNSTDAVSASIMARARAIAANSPIVLAGRTPQQQQTLRNLIDALRASRPTVGGGVTSTMPGLVKPTTTIKSVTSSGVGVIAPIGGPVLPSVTEGEAVLVAVVEVMLIAGIVIVLGPALPIAMAIGAIIAAVVTILINLPAILNAVALLLNALGLPGARELNNAAGWYATNISAPLIAVTAIFCALIAMITTRGEALVSIVMASGEEALRILA